MPRPFRTPGVLGPLAIAAGCAALGPAALHAALAAAAGTLFEAAPFVLVAELLPAGRLRALSGFAGCGCGSRVPGALALGAVALCWFAFGPLVTFARTLAAVGLLAYRRWRGRLQESHSPPDALAELLPLGPAAALATLASAGLAHAAPALGAAAAGRLALLGAGAAVGALAPCGTAAVAIAAAFAPHAPSAAAGVLLTGGLFAVTGGLIPRPLRRRAPGGAGGAGASCAPSAGVRARRAVVARAGLTGALAVFAVVRAPGFINPRLWPLATFATVVAAAGVRRPVADAAAVLIPATMLAAVACGSPQPAFEAQATQLEAAFAGERLAFTGVAYRRGTSTVLERFAITCCRADAAPVAVRIARLLPIPDGAWVRAYGVLDATTAGLVLQPAGWRRVGAPADPFLYR